MSEKRICILHFGQWSYRVASRTVNSEQVEFSFVFVFIFFFLLFRLSSSAMVASLVFHVHAELPEAHVLISHTESYRAYDGKRSTGSDIHVHSLL